MRVAKKELLHTIADLSLVHGDRREAYFALLWLAQEFQQPPSNLTSQVSFPDNALGLDAFYVDAQTHSLNLYTFRWTEDHTHFKEPFRKLADLGIEALFGLGSAELPQGDFLLTFKAKLHEHASSIERVCVHFVFNGRTEDAESSAILDSLREDLEAKKYLIDQYFEGRPVTLSFQFVSNLTKKAGGRTHLRQTHEYSVAFPERIAAVHQSGATMDIGFVSLVELHDMHEEMGLRLFERNIRAGLKSEQAANRAVRKALARIVLEQVDSPDLFAFNHNGVTIAVERFDYANGKATLTEPRILNGAQTVTTFSRFLGESAHAKAFASRRSILRRIRVLAKVISKASPDFIVNVTICNNQQNPVLAWHLRASDPLQLELQDKFRIELKIFYERQENSFEAIKDDDLLEYGIEHDKALRIRPMAQTFLAIQGEIDRISRLPEVFESETSYRSTFRESYLRVDARRILFFYKMQFRLGRVIREIIEKGAQKYAYMGKARNLVWALLVQAVLHDEQLEVKVAQYGGSMTLEADYTEYLRDLASRRVRLIMSEAFAEPRYEEAIAQQKYGFLRTKAAFNRCMEVAQERFGWSKRSI